MNMNATKFALCLLWLLLELSTALATDAAKTARPAKSTLAKEAKAAARTEPNAVLTGSYIKRTVKRSGLVTDGATQVIVIDRDTIQHSGAADVRQVLARYIR